MSEVVQYAGYTTPCRMTGETLHGVASPDWQAFRKKVLQKTKCLVHAYLAHTKLPTPSGSPFGPR